MSKKGVSYILNMIIALSFVIAALFWLFSTIPATQDAMGGYSLEWAVVQAAATTCIIFIIKGIWIEEEASYKRIYFVVGAIFGIVAVIAGVFEGSLPEKAVAPAITVLVVVAIAASIAFTTFARNWDRGDNQDPTYQNYNERKANKINKASKTDEYWK